MSGNNKQSLKLCFKIKNYKFYEKTNGLIK